MLGLADALLALAILIQAGVLLLALRAGVESRAFSVLFGLLFLVLFLVVPLLLNLTVGTSIVMGASVYGPIDDEGVLLRYALVALGCVLVFAAFTLARRRAAGSLPTFPNAKVARLSSVSARDGWIHTASAVAFLFGVVLFLRATGYAPASLLRAIMKPSRFGYMSNEGFSSGLSAVALYLASSVALYGYYDVRLGVPRRALTALVSLAILLMTVFTGSRQWLLLGASGALAAYVLHYRIRIVRLLVLGSVFGVFLFIWQLARAQFWLTQPDASLGQLLGRLLAQGDISYFYSASLESIRQYRKNDLYFPFNVFRVLALLPFPRGLTFGIKTPDLAFLFGDAVAKQTTLRQGNYPAGLIGLFVLNFGYAGAVIGPALWAGLLMVLDRVRLGNAAWNVGAALSVFTFLQLSRGTYMGFYLAFFLLVLVGLTCATRDVVLIAAGRRRHSHASGAA